MRFGIGTLTFLVVSHLALALDNPQESKVLHMGKIPPGKVVLGTVMAVVPGFGAGHAVQGRYESDGWLFTVGEAAGLGFIGIEMASNGGVFPGSGVMGMLGVATVSFFKLWEFYDALFGAIRHNQYYDRTKIKMDKTEGPRWSPFPIVAEGGGGLGVAVIF